MTQIKTKIPAELEPAAVGGMVTDSKYIIDRVKNKNQTEINTEVGTEITNIKGGSSKSIANLDSEINGNGGIDERLGTVEQLAEISIGGGDAQIATGEDFHNPTAEQRAKVPTVGAILDGADDEPIDGSNNLVKSGGVFNNISSIYNLTGKVSVDRCYSSQISAKGNEVGITLTISSSSENWSLFGILLGKAGDLKANRNVYVVVDMPDGAAYDINQVALSKNPASFGPSYIIAPSSSLGKSQIIGSDGEMSAVVYSIPDTIDLSGLSDNDNVYFDFGCKETNVQLSGRTNNIYVCKNYIPYSYNPNIVNGAFYANHEAIEKVKSDVSELHSTVQRLDTEIDGIEANTQVLVKTTDDFNIYTDNNYEYEYLSDGYGIKIVNTKEDTSTSTWNIIRLYVGTVAELKQSLRAIYLSDITISNGTDIHFIKTREGSWSPSNTIGDGEIISRSGNEVVIGLSDNTISALSGLSDTQQVYLAMGYRSDTQHSITSSEASAYLSYISLDISEFKECLKKKDITIPYVLNPRIKKIEDTIGELIQKEKVVCWGDSLTAGAGADSLTNYQTVITKLNQLTGLSLSADTGRTYPEMLNILLSDDYIVSNMGVGGETINTIGAREGANAPILQPSFTLPADGSEVKVGERTNENNMGLLSSWNETEQTLVNVLMQGSPSLGINPCYIQGIPCTLGYRDSSYYLKRNVTVNNNVSIPSNSELVLNGMKQSIDADVAILWCYQNGGYYNESDLLNKIIKMVDALPTKKFIILNLHSQLTGTDVLKKYFGNKFFNWNQYVTSNALTDFGITPTSQDIADMSNHLAPTSLRKDNVHLNSAGYAILAYQIYLHGLSLGYWN